MRVLADPSTYNAAPGTELRGVDFVFPVAAVGDGFAFAAGVVTLTDLSALFVSSMVGRQITILGATTPGNDGTFVIRSVSGGGTVITYTNAAGFTEPAVAGVTTWTLEGGDMQVGFLPIRAWTDFAAAIPPSGSPSRNSFDVTSVAATGATGSGSQLIAEPFTP
jgi:hypothetical protein